GRVAVPVQELVAAGPEEEAGHLREGVPGPGPVVLTHHQGGEGREPGGVVHVQGPWARFLAVPLPVLLLERGPHRVGRRGGEEALHLYLGHESSDLEGRVGREERG